MTIHADIRAALASLAMLSAQKGDGIFSVVPEDIDPPFVVMRRTLRDPLVTLSGPTGDVNSTFRFECWAKQKADAVTLAGQVAAAIEASSLTATPVAVGDEDYDPDMLVNMEPIAFSIWHTE